MTHRTKQSFRENFPSNPEYFIYPDSKNTVLSAGYICGADKHEHCAGFKLVFLTFFMKEGHHTAYHTYETVHTGCQRLLEVKTLKNMVILCLTC